MYVDYPVHVISYSERGRGKRGYLSPKGGTPVLVLLGEEYLSSGLVRAEGVFLSWSCPGGGGLPLSWSCPDGRVTLSWSCPGGRGGGPGKGPVTRNWGSPRKRPGTRDWGTPLLILPVTGFPYHLFGANQQKVNVKILSLTQCAISKDGCDWHILAGIDERIV